MVEKHLMLDVGDPESGWIEAYDKPPLDAGHSIEPDEFARYVRAIRDTEAMLANTDRKLSGSQWRRRLVFARDLPAGHVLTADDVAVKRCGEGTEPWEDVTTAKLPESVRAGDPVDVELLDDANTDWAEEGYAWDASA
jgi:sialic acid synthase SpsE